MRQRNGTWLAVGFVLALSACEDEILTDVDLPKDASADRGADAPKEGANTDSASTDSGPDERTETTDGSGADGSDGAARADGSDAASPEDASDAGRPDGADGSDAQGASDGAPDATAMDGTTGG